MPRETEMKKNKITHVSLQWDKVIQLHKLKPFPNSWTPPCTTSNPIFFVLLYKYIWNLTQVLCLLPTWNKKRIVIKEREGVKTKHYIITIIIGVRLV
jgi:hypothetical protein